MSFFKKHLFRAKKSKGGAEKWAPSAGELPGNMPNVEEGKSSQLQTVDVQTPVVAGIDLGTTSFGYTFMFANEPEKLFVELGKEREPTCLLLKPDKTFAALG